MLFVAKICKRVPRASTEGYLAVAASTPTSARLLLGDAIASKKANSRYFAQLAPLEEQQKLL